MSKLIEYRLISEIHTVTFNTKVNEALKQGFIMFQVDRGLDKRDGAFTAVMHKYDTETSK